MSERENISADEGFTCDCGPVRHWTCNAGCKAEARRMFRIEKLMEADPALGTPEGDELNRLVDIQEEHERQTLGDWE